MDYETGLLIAFLMWLFQMVWMIVLLNSRVARNLAKIGMRLSWLTLQPRQATDAERHRTWLGATAKYLLIAGIGLVSVLLSWLYVVWVIGAILYRRFKDAGQPTAVREFRWKLRNIDMGFDQLAKELYTLNGAMGMAQPPFDDFRRDLWQIASNT